MARIASRGKIIAAVLLAFAALMAFYIWRDLNLSFKVDLDNLPDLVAINPAFERTIGGKDWKVKADRAEHKEGVVSASDLLIEVIEPSTGREFHIKAKSGEYTRESEDMSLVSIEGSAVLEDRSVDLKASAADYESEKDTWTFTGGFVGRDRLLIVSGDRAELSSGGVFTIEKEAEARWSTKE